MKKQRYELISGKSAKFWEVYVRGSSMTTTYGRVKTKGQSTVKKFPSPDAAKTAAEKLIAQKLKKGYTQTGGPKTQSNAKPATKKTAKKKTARKTAKKKFNVTKLGESAALKLAKSPDTSKTDLRKLAGRFDKVDRALAKRDDVSATLLEKLSRSKDRITRRSVATNPNCGRKTLLRLAPQFPAELLKSQFDRMLIEDPACFHKMDEDMLVRLLKQDSCPEALVQYGLHLGEQRNLSNAQAAVFLLAGIRRLEDKFPYLKELGSIAPAIQPNYGAIIQEVEPHLVDRKGSLLGGPPFLSKRFPMRGDKAPMLQLDLAEASRVTNEDLGDGLLQLWINVPGWGFDGGEDEGAIRIIPRHIVAATKHLLDVPEREAAKDLERTLARIKAEYAEKDEELEKKIKDALAGHLSAPPGNGETLEEKINDALYEYRWQEELAGVWFDYPSFKPSPPLQITGWEASGYTFPDEEAEFWDPCSFERALPQEVYEDPIFMTMKVIKAVAEGMEARNPNNSLCTLFGRTHYTSDSYFWSDKPDWRPLVGFDGPLRHCIDEHTVFFRGTPGRFEYGGAGGRGS